jgi:YggT family protein
MVFLLAFYALEVLKWLIIARAVMSWFVAPHSRHPIAQGLRRITDPILLPIAAAMPSTGGVDVSPLIAFFLIYFVQRAIVGLV